MSQSVTVLGPNLSAAGQALGSMHVHATGCADIKRTARKYRYDNVRPDRYGWEIDVNSVEDIVEAVYPAGDFEYTGPSDEYYDTYRNDIHVFPCVTVPETPEKKEEPVSDTVVIESEEYEATRVGLMADPVIQAMAKGVPIGVNLDSWEFISSASRYYASQEGRTYDGPLHIGGPAEAIRRIKEADGSAHEGWTV